MHGTKLAGLIGLSLLTMSAGAEGGEKPGVVTILFKRRMDFFNKPLKNRFVLEDSGTEQRHLRHTAGKLLELRQVTGAKTKLLKAMLKGKEIPTAFIELQAPSMFGGTHSSFALTRYDLEGSGSSDFDALKRIFAVQYIDQRVVAALARVCERDWRRIETFAKGSGGIQWSIPGLYRSMRFTKSASVERIKGRGPLAQISIRLDGTGPSIGTGARRLRGFTFEGLFDPKAGRFCRVRVRCSIENLKTRIEQRIDYQHRIVNVETVSSAARPAYELNVERLAKVAEAVQAGDHAGAVSLYDAGRSKPGMARFQRTGDDFLKESRRIAKGIDWSQHKSLRAALAAAKSCNKPLLVLVDQDGCPPCMVLHKTVIRDPAFVGAVQSGFLAVNLNFCIDRESLRDFKLIGTPTLLILSPEGVELGRQVGVKPLAASLGLLRSVLLTRPKSAPSAKKKKRRYI